MLGNNERRKRIKVKRIEKFTNKIVDQKKRENSAEICREEAKIICIAM